MILAAGVINKEEQRFTMWSLLFGVSGAFGGIGLEFLYAPSKISDSVWKIVVVALL